MELEILLGDDCPYCGSILQVETCGEDKENDEYFVKEGAKVLCTNSSCEFESEVEFSELGEVGVKEVIYYPCRGCGENLEAYGDYNISEGYCPDCL